MPDLESLKNVTCIVTKPPRTPMKIKASLQSGQKELGQHNTNDLTLNI